MIRELELKEISPFAKRIEFCDEDIVLGYLDYSLIYDRIEIDNFLVNMEYRNRGIGKILMDYLVSIANRLNVVNITLEVRVSNDVAIHLYKKYGFKEVALRKYYYGDEDGILMEMQVM